MTGQRLLHYDIVAELGRGGMGVVYKARDTHLDRFVAIKVLPPEKVSDPTRKARFVQEAKAASALNHTNIITIYDISSDGGIDFIAMEYVDGKTLDQLIPRKGMRLNEALKVAVQIADALARAHQAGIIHRDLKPANIMVDSHGHVKVLDFGLAKLTEQGDPADASTATAAVKTEEGTIAGTAAYMSPEQAEGKPLDTRSDIFSFGAVLYEMLTGHRAFQGDSRMSTLSAILQKEPLPFSEEVPADLRKLVTRCLRKDRDKRFHHMVDVRVAIEELREESDSGKLVPVATKAIRSRRLLTWIASLVVLLALAAVGYWAWRAKSAATVAEYRVAPLTASPGHELQPTFSPDGSQVAYVWNGENQENYDIYVKLIGGGAPLRLTTDPAEEMSPAWSPDGRWIAFLRMRGYGAAKILLIPALGGPERAIGELRVWMEDLYYQFHLAWTPDGKWLIVGDEAHGGEPAGLFLLSPDSGARRRLTTGRSLSPAPSPDGSRLAFVRLAGTRISDLYLLELSDSFAPHGEPRRLTSLNANVKSPAWCPDGHEITFTSGGHEYARGLWRINASPGSSPRRETVGEDAVNLAISRNSRRLVYSPLSLDADIWRIRLRGRTQVDGSPVRIISSTRVDDNAAYSPDGKRIAFNSGRSGNGEVWVSGSDGSNPLQLTTARGPMVANPQWSPDRQHLAFHSLLGAARGIDIIDINGGVPRRIAEGGAMPTWSRDGKWVYFGGRQGQLWKAPFRGGEAIQVTTQGGSGSAFESADGEYLYYLNKSHVWRMRRGGGQESQLVQQRVSYGMNLAVVEEGLYLIAASDFVSPGTLYYFDFKTSTLTPVMTIERWYLGLSVSPDGRSILYSQLEPLKGNLVLVENFR